MHTNLKYIHRHDLSATRWPWRLVFVGVLSLTAAGLAACDPPPPKTFCNGSTAATIVGTAGNDVLNGTDGADVIAGLAGNDTISGLGGEDRICGGNGTDSVSGGSGDDFLYGGPDSDSIVGGTGADWVSYQYSSSGVVVDLKAGRGGEADTISAVENIMGTAYVDHLTGDDGPNSILGLDDGDTMIGLGGNDRMGGVDYQQAVNHYYGGPGDDTFLGGSDHDIAAYDGSSATTVFVDLGAEIARGEGNDTLQLIDGTIGTAGNDTLYGGPRSDLIEAGEGDDVVNGRGGDDTIDGGPGADRATWSTSSAGVVVNLAAGSATGQGSDTVVRIEHLTGSIYDDLLTGSTGPNVIDGSSGIDICLGGGGTDTFIRCE